ncbi:hypothetical protein RhiJN_21383 [Ceratobasidium sp. AG-Ba]|nr:hypothetical protein RhiJN_21383 [Ceratobasidium sp. AG-Ba]
MFRSPANLKRLFTTLRPKRALGLNTKELVAETSSVAVGYKLADQTSVKEWLSSNQPCPRYYTQHQINLEGPVLNILTASVHRIHFYLEGKREYLILDLSFTTSAFQQPFVVYCCLEPAAMSRGSSDFGGSVRFDAQPGRLHNQKSSKLIGCYEYDKPELSLCQVLGMCSKSSLLMPQSAMAGSSELYCLDVYRLREELSRHPGRWFQPSDFYRISPNLGEEVHYHNALATEGSCIDFIHLRSNEAQCSNYFQPAIPVRVGDDPPQALRGCTKACASYYKLSGEIFLPSSAPCIGCDTLPIYNERPTLDNGADTGSDETCPSLRPNDKVTKELVGHGGLNAESLPGTSQDGLDGGILLENDTLDAMDHEPNPSVGTADSAPFATNVGLNPPGPPSFASIQALSEATKDEMKGTVFIKKESQEGEPKDHCNNLNAGHKEPFIFTAEDSDDSIPDLVQEIQPQYLKCAHPLTIDSGCVEGNRTVRQVYSRLPASHCHKWTLRLYRFQYRWQRLGCVKHKLFGLCLPDVPVVALRRLPLLPTGEPRDYFEADAWVNHGDLGWDAFPGNQDALGFSMDLNLSSSLDQMDSHSRHNNSNAIRSGQGPGNYSIDVQNNESIPDLQTLTSWAGRRGYQLVPIRYNDLNAYPPRASNLQPRSPVPLPLGLPSSTIEIDTSGNTYSNVPDSFGSSSWSLGNRSLGNSLNLEPMFTSVDPPLVWSDPPVDLGLRLLPRHEPSASQLRQDPGLGCTRNLRGTDTWESLSMEPESSSVFSSLPILPGERALGLRVGALSYTVSETHCNRDQEVTVITGVDHALSGSLLAQAGMTHTFNHRQTTTPVRNTTPQLGPMRTSLKFSCQVNGCGQSFSRPHKLNDHTSFVHHGLRKYCCTAPGCDKRYSNPSNRKRHYKQAHGGHDPESGSIEI